MAGLTTPSPDARRGRTEDFVGASFKKASKIIGDRWKAKGQRPKSITQHSHPKTAAPRIDPAQDLVGRPNEKSAFENYFESNA